MKALQALSIVAAICASAPAVLAQSPLPGAGPFELHDIVNAWVIHAEPAAERCVMERLDEAGTLFQIGRTRDRDAFYVALFTQRNVAFPPAGPSTLVVDDAQFEVDLARVQSAQIQVGLNGGYVIVEDAALRDAIFNGRVMSLVPVEGNAVIVDLTGTDAAIESALACEAAL
jgi:hypothetical protein